jgi:integrase
MSKSPAPIAYPEGFQGGSTRTPRRESSMLPAPGNIPLSQDWSVALEGFDLFLQSQDRAPGTIASRMSCSTVMAKWASHDGIEPGQIHKNGLTRYLLAQYEGRAGRGRVNYYQSLRCFWRWYSQEYEAPDPMKTIPRPGGTSKQVPVLTPAEVDQVLAACKTPRDTAIVLLLMSAGLRRAELAALDWTDLDLKSRLVTIKRGKGGRARVSVMDQPTVHALWKWRKSRQDEHQAVFIAKGGARLGLSGVNQAVARIGARAGIEGLHPHMFRHCWAHYSLAAGVPEHALMKLAGWSSASMIGHYGAALAEQRAIEAGRAVQVSKLAREKSA